MSEWTMDRYPGYLMHREPFGGRAGRQSAVSKSAGKEVLVRGLDGQWTVKWVTEWTVDR